MPIMFSYNFKVMIKYIWCIIWTFRGHFERQESSYISFIDKKRMRASILRYPRDIVDSWFDSFPPTCVMLPLYHSWSPTFLQNVTTWVDNWLLPLIHRQHSIAYRHVNLKETLFPSVAHALKGNPTFFFLFFCLCEEPEELSTKVQYILHVIKLKPELYL